MRTYRWLLLVWACLNLGGFAQVQAAVRPTLKAHIMTVPGLPGVACGGVDSKYSVACDSIELGIGVVQIPNPNGGSNLCLAYFFYNTLTVFVGTQNAGAVLTWKEPADAHFVGYGITITPPHGLKVGDIVEWQRVGQVKIKSQALLKTQFSHFPNVEQEIDGKRRTCGPVDPGIIVNSD